MTRRFVALFAFLALVAQTLGWTWSESSRGAKAGGATPTRRMSLTLLGGVADQHPHDTDTDTTKPERFSGYFRLDRTYAAEMFFFLFERRDAADDAPVVLWMTGGPGCSSELAVFYENGPYALRRDENREVVVDETEFGWDRAATMIFVDQPINTGFSFSENDSDRCYDEACVAKDMEDFFVALLRERPELQNRPLFITGESYAGHYVPAVAYQLFQSASDGLLKGLIDFRGLAIGNGLTVPSIQYGAYPVFARQHDLISEETKDQMLSMAPLCQYSLEACDEYDWSLECYLAVMFCQTTMFSPILFESPGVNVYDYTKQCEGDLCYDFSLADEYLNRPDVQRALGVKNNKAWEQCDMSVHEDMMSDWGHRYDNAIPEMLEAGKRVLIYAGDQDIICNELGNRWWVDALEWSGRAEWARAQDEPWEVDGEHAGTIKTAGGLSFVSVAGAGHMVPMDKPKQGLDMITRFITHEKNERNERNEIKPREMPTRNTPFIEQ